MGPTGAVDEHAGAVIDGDRARLELGPRAGAVYRVETR
jgi:hypothetical protein